MLRKISLLAALLFFVTASQAQDKLDLGNKFPGDPNVRTGTLSNGIRYYVRKNSKPEHRAELRLAVNVGATMESENQRGLAHFVEHMCFNGTKNFKKSELVDYLESIGTKFGPHLNAYTSFDETVYMLQLPTDSAQYVTKGLQILEDWAHNVSFDADEIDKERGVVTEEWRLGLGADERMREKYFPVLFKGSRYAERLPIGKPEILKNAPYDTLRKFYKDWYRPDLMAVIAVGDFDPAEMEQKIKDQFSKIPAAINGRPVVKWDIPDNEEPLVSVVSDKENPYTQIQIFYKQPAFKQNYISDYRQTLVHALYSNMINARLGELTQKANPPFLYGYSGYSGFLRPKDVYTEFAIVADGGIQRGIETLVEENNRVRLFGFTASELERAKQELLTSIERSYSEREKTESRGYAEEYVRNFLTHEPIPGIAFEYELYKKYVPGIALEEVNGLAGKWITNGKNQVVLITAPEKAGNVLPTDKEVLAMIKAASEKQTTAYVDEVTDEPLMKEKPKAGQVKSEQTIKEMGATEYTLSNGVKVILKSTDFKNDEILFQSYGWGGSSLNSEADNQSADYASYIVGQSGVGSINNIQLDKMLKGKIVSVSPYIGNYNQGFSGSCSPKDLETAMQLIYLYATQPRKDEEAFNAIMDQQKGFIMNRTTDPAEVFNDTVIVTMASYHPRVKPSSLEELNKVSLDRSYQIYKDHFKNFSGHTFVFVGNVKPEEFKKLAEQYLGALPSGTAEHWKDLGIHAPKGKIEKTVRRGVEPKANVEMHLTGAFEWNVKNRMELRALMSILSIKLRENLREDKGGVYGVSAYGSPSRIPKPSFDIVVSFGCAPENVPTLVDAVWAEINKLKQNGAEEKELTKVKETLRREREVSLKENRFWLSTISQYSQNGDPWSDLEAFYKIIDSLDKESVKKLANHYFSGDNYAKFILLPEK